MKRNLASITRVTVLVSLLSGMFTLAGIGTQKEVASASTSPADNLTVVRVYYPDMDMANKIFLSFEGAIIEANYEEGYYIMEVTPEEMALLEAKGLRIEVDEAWSQPPQRQSAFASFAGIPGYACYRTVEETIATAQSIADNYPDLASWVDIGDSWEKTAGLGGYDMQVLVLTNKSVSGPKPRLFVMSEIHAREYPTTELVLRFAEQLINNYGNDADATWLLDYHEIHLLLYTNPDGRKKAETGLMWRKNTNQNYCGATSNDRGADINRNFEYQWNCCGGSSSSQCVETYHGPSAASEPETQAIQNYLRAIFPDQRGPNPIDAAPLDATGVFLSIHGGTRLVIWPWAFTASSTSNGNQLQTLGRKFAYWNHYPAQQAIGLYVTDGSDEDFAYGDLGIAAYEFEISASFFQDCATFENTILPDNLPALMYAAKAARTPYMTPAGPDAYDLSVSQDGVQAGTPVTLAARIDDTRYTGGEPMQNVTAAEYYLDVPPWQDGSTAYTMSALDGSFDNTSEDIQTTVDTTDLAPGRHTVFVRGQDIDGNWGAISAIFLDIADEPVETLMLLAPTDGSNTSSPIPTFAWWSNITGTAEYQIQVDNNLDFSSPEIDVTTTTSDYTPTSGLAPDTYYWHVRVNNGGSSDYSIAWAITIAISPATPVLTSPTDGSTTADNTPTFTWDDVTGATQYQIQVDDNADFSSPVISTAITASTFTPTSALPNAAYSWRVRASNGVWGDYSSAWTMTIAVTPATPSLTSPSNGSTTADSTPSFDWGNVTGAIQYQIQVDNNADFSSPEIDATTTTSIYTPTTELALGTYSWHVRASNGLWSSYSSTRTVTISMPPAIPTLELPANGSTTTDNTPTFYWGDVTGAYQYQIQVDNNADFSSPTFSATPYPAMYTPTSALANGIYYWRVRAYNGVWGDYSGAWTVTVAAPPAVPTLVSPANGSTTGDSTPTFDWNDVTGATQYQIQVDDNADFSSPEMDANMVTSTYTPTSELALGAYSWRVRASNGLWGSYSSARTVTIVVPPAAPILALPADSSTTADSTPTFDWNDVTGATQYQIQVDNNADFSSPVISTTTTVSTYTPILILANTVYSWRVRADNGMWGEYSNTWTVTVAVPPAVPTLTLPANGSVTAYSTPDFDWNNVTGATLYQIQVDDNADFSSPEIDATTATSAYTPTTVLVEGTYSWRVRASNGVWGNYSSTRTVTIAMPPNLVSPANGSTIDDSTPTFDWEDVTGATQYKIQLANFASFSNYSYYTTTTSNQTWGQNLLNGTYYWRVQAYTGGWGVNSDIWMLTIAVPPAIPTLASPANASAIGDNTPTFDWNSVTGATQYQIQVDDNTDFSSPEIDTTTTDSTYTPTSELALGAYSWRVRAYNGAWSDASDAWALTITLSPAIPTLVSPADSSTIDDSTPTFDWDDVTGVAQYYLQVDDNADFSSPLTISTTNSSYTYTMVLVNDTYYWHVKASWGDYSDTWALTIDALPVAPILIAPANGSAMGDNTPTFDWNSVTGATQYQLQVDDNTDFSSPEVDTTTTDSTYTPTSGLALGVYSWRVRAYNGIWGIYSTATLTIVLPPAIPTLVSPANGSTTDDSTPTLDWEDVTGATQYHIQVDDNADFSSPSGAFTNTSSYTFATELVNGPYYWRVQAYNVVWGDYSGAWTVTIAAPPAAPILASPADGSTTSDNTPTFTWGNVTGATQYQIQVDDNADFSSPVISTTTTASTYTPTSSLASVIYSWRVRASSGAWSDYSSAWTLTVNVIPAVPILVSPANASFTGDSTPIFDWNDVTGATQYQIQVDNNSDFSSPEADATTATSTYTPTPVLALGTYSWRVRAYNGAWGDYSSAWTVTITAPPAAPTLTSPTNGSTTTDNTPTFTWSSVTGATLYQLQVDDNADFSSPAIDTTTTTLTYTPTSTLPSVTYSWRVRASNGAWSDTSSVWMVTVAVSPAIPIMASPANGSATADSTPTFDWTDVTGATQYQIQVDNNADFSSPEIDTTTATSTYTPTSELALGTYSWRVRASNGMWGSYSSAWTVTIAVPPAAPILASPADGSTTTDNTPIFTWGNVTGATQYQIQVDNNADFSSPEISVTTTTSAYTPTSMLANAIYSWRVRASNGVWSDYSSAWTVTVAALPAKPGLVSPANGSTTGDSTPTFDWNDVTGAMQYQIQVDNNADFSSPEIDTTTATSVYTPTSELALGTYYWHARASNGLWSSYSSARTVTIVLPPAAPSLVSPANGSSVDDSTPTFDWSNVTGATLYQLQVDDNADFSSPVFSVSLSISTYTRNSALANGLYYWRVRASNGMWSDYSSVWTVTIALPPAAPTLASPVDGSTIADGTPGFDWGNVTRAVQYQIQIDNNTDFSSPEIDITGSPSTYTPTPFLPNGTYSWHARAVDMQNNWGDWSAPWLITIADDNRLDTSLNSTWRFYQGDITGAQEVGFDDSGWTLLDLPHTWNNLDGQDGGNNYYRGIGWYRKHYTIPSEYAGKRVFIRFEAVNKVADVYVNGTLVGRHAGGFAAFAFDITDTVSIGADNVIAVKADNSASLDIAPLSGDFNQDGGIYRPVHLLVTGKAHITPLDYGSPGVYLTPTNVSAGSADLQVATKVDNTGDTQEMVTVRTTIKDADGTEVATLTSTQDMAASSSATFIQTTTLANPHLWNGRSDPYLYQAVVQVRLGDTIVDEVAQPLGFRTFQVDPDTGFTLNGNPLDLYGAGMHENREDKGRAISDVDRAEDIGLIMDMGATFVRLAHYQHGETTYDLCDENGLVVWTEIPLVNYTGSSNAAFSDNIKQQLVELIRQNYNHPSVFFWSLYNAIQTTNVSLIAELNDLAHQEDATRLTTGATPTSFSPSASLPIDLVGWDMYRAWYGGSFEDGVSVITNAHTYHPYLGISEYGAGANISHHEENPLAPDPYGDWHPEEYQSIFHETYWKQMEAMPFLWVKSIFAAFDFASDSRAEGDRPGINDKGIITSDRSIKKDAFYWYKANWSDEPVVYITSRRFTPRDNSLVEVKVYSNCDSIQLLVNDVSHGSKTSTDHIYRWTDVILAGGNNAVRAVCTIGAEQYEDSITWDGGVALSPLPVGLHQETDSRIDYTGTWTSYVGSEPNGGSTNTTIQQNATVRFDFEGTELRLYRTTASDRGPMQICVDTVCQTVQNDSPTTQWNQMVSIATGLADGVHQASIRNLTTSTIDLDAVEVLIPPAAPSLLSPADGSTTADPTPTFGWDDVTGATEYQIQVDDNSNFTSPEIDETLTSSAYIHTSALVNGTYYWHVRASNGAWGGYSGAWMVTVAVPPAMPTLLTPANGSITTDNTPALGWEDIADATQYQIQVDNNTDFSSPVIDTIVTTSAYTATFALVDRTYSWRVRAGDGTGLWSEYSEPWTVAVDTTPPSVPILASPANGAVTKDDTPDFDWGDITGATQYQIQVDNNSNFASPEINATEVTISAYTPTSELNDGTYYWRVRAGDGANLWSAYSAARRVVIDTTAPTFPGLLTPANNASVRGTPTYTWGAVSTAVRYEFQYDDEDTFSEPFYTSGELAVRSHKPPAQTPGVYYWRVKARDAAGNWGAWSAVRTITILPVIPAAPVLESPLNAAQTRDTTPTLQWKASAGGNSYQVQLDNTSTCASPEQGATGSELSFTAAELSPGTYYWRVRAINVNGEMGAWSAIWRVVIDTTGPAAPALSAPASNASVRGTPTYTWGAVSTAVRYEFQYDDEDTFSEPFYTSGELAVRSHKPPAQTPDVYYWRVKARDAAGNWGAWSAVRTIIILPLIPAAPVLESPLNAAQTKDTTPTLQWKVSAGGNSYQVQFDNTSTCTSPEQDATGSELSFTAAVLSPGTYYWRVRAINVNGEMGAWSAIWRVVIDTTGPVVPALSTPASNASVRGTPTYVWLATATAVRYEFQYDNNADFSSPEYTSIELAVRSHKPPAQTPDVYYWRVRARDTAGNWSEWSPPRRILIY